MNTLEQFIKERGLEENEDDIMDELQDEGIVSDNCEHAKDVAEEDCERAIEFLTTFLL